MGKKKESKKVEVKEVCRVEMKGKSGRRSGVRKRSE